MRRQEGCAKKLLRLLEDEIVHPWCIAVWLNTVGLQVDYDIIAHLSTDQFL